MINDQNMTKGSTTNYKLPNQLCQQIYNSQIEIDIGNVSQELITKTVQLYVEAMTIFANIISQNCQNPDFDLKLTRKKHAYYQQKIKKLLTKNQVQKCLVGKQTNSKTLNFQRELAKIHQNAPQQTKMLIQHFKNHHKNQQNLINSSISQQQQNFNQRLNRRKSFSIGKKPTQNQNRQIQNVNIPKIKKSNNGKPRMIGQGLSDFRLF